MTVVVVVVVVVVEVVLTAELEQAQGPDTAPSESKVPGSSPEMRRQPL